MGWFGKGSKGPGGVLPAPNAPGDYLQANQALGWSAVPPALWATQAAWFLDAAAGSDLNDGLTALTPLKTIGNLALRISGQTLLQDTTITLVGDFSTEDLALEIFMAPTKVLTIDGGLTVVAVGALTGVTAINRTTGQALVLTDAAVANWNLFVGMMLVITGGVRDGALAVIDKDLGANQARCSGMNSIVEANGTVTAVTPVIADNYTIYQPTAKARSQQLVVHRDYDPAGSVAAIVKGIQFTDDNAESLALATDTGTLEVLRCTFASASIQHASSLFFGCNFDSASGFLELIAMPSAQALPSAIAGSRLARTAAAFGNFIFEYDTLARAQIAIGRGSTVSPGNLGIYDSTSSAIFIHRGANCTPTGTVYGTGNARYGFENQIGTNVLYSTKPTVTGALGNVLMVNDVLAYASIPIALAGCCFMSTAATFATNRIYFGCTSTSGADAGNRYLVCGGSSLVAPSAAYQGGAVVMDRPGVITSIEAGFKVSALAAADCTFIVQINGVDSTLSVLVPATTLRGSASGVIPYVVGDKVSVRIHTTVADATGSQPYATVAA